MSHQVDASPPLPLHQFPVPTAPQSTASLSKFIYVPSNSPADPTAAQGTSTPWPAATLQRRFAHLCQGHAWMASRCTDLYTLLAAPAPTHRTSHTTAQATCNSTTAYQHDSRGLHPPGLKISNWPGTGPGSMWSSPWTLVLSSSRLQSH